jgi:peptidoglycan L-alanyl-D-glutamate endopeptidase CwlK
MDMAEVAYMTRYKFSHSSLSRLKNVHPILIAITALALRRYADMDFGVIEGVRTEERQKEMVEKGASQTMRSYHLVGDDGFGRAVDLAPWKDGKIPWHDWGAFEQLADAMQDAANELGYGNKLTWGGDWDSLRDGPHFQLEI